MRVFYISSLEGHAVVSYGGAWPGDWSDVKPGSDLDVSHAYSADLQFDVKGVHFSAGQGLGQVVGHSAEWFTTLSFDAIF